MDALAGIAALALLGLGAAIAAVICARFRIPLAVATSFLFLSAAWLAHMMMRGSVLLIDHSGHVASLALVNGNGAREMYRGPVGIFYGEPRGDSSVRLICTDGRKMELGYATPGMPMIQRLERPTSC